MKLSELYSEYIANWLSNGSLISRDKISLLGIRPLFDRFLTNQYITKTWEIFYIPVHYNKNLTQMIRDEMYTAFPEVKTIIHLYNTPLNVYVNTDQFHRRLNRAANDYYQYKDVFDSLSAAEQETGISEMSARGGRISINATQLGNIKDKYDSYMYVHSAVNSGKNFMHTYMFVQASCDNRVVMQKFGAALFRLVQGEGVGIRAIQGDVGQYLDNFCPASFIQSDTRKFQPMLFSQENVASFIPNKTKGLVGSGCIMLGENWQTHLPFSLDFTGSGTSQVVLVCGKSGCGKTFLAEEVSIELTSFGIHCSITDIKGGEWNKVARYVDTIEIDMSGAGSRFVNLMRIDDLECDTTNCQEAYEAAIANTVGLFEVATNLIPTEGNPSDLRAILNQAVEKVYTNNGVDKKNPETFAITRDFKYEMVLDVLITLEQSRSYTEDQKRLSKLIKSRCSTYFLGEGRYSEAFKNELTVADILDVPMVIYNFNKNKGETLDIIDNIRVFMARCMDSRKHFLRKQKGLHQAVFYEELQRCGAMSTFIQNISSDVTGSRSNNLTVFLLLNAVSTFDAENFAAIKSNITTKIIGKVSSKDIEKLVTDYDCDDIELYMKKIKQNKGSRMEHCFAVSYDTGNDKDCLIMRTVVPKEMTEQFATRDILKL